MGTLASNQRLFGDAVASRSSMVCLCPMVSHETVFKITRLINCGGKGSRQPSILLCGYYQLLIARFMVRIMNKKQNEGA